MKAGLQNCNMAATVRCIRVVLSQRTSLGVCLAIATFLHRLASTRACGGRPVVPADSSVLTVSRNCLSCMLEVLPGQKFARAHGSRRSTWLYGVCHASPCLLELRPLLVRTEPPASGDIFRRPRCHNALRRGHRTSLTESFESCQIWRGVSTDWFSFLFLHTPPGMSLALSFTRFEAVRRSLSVIPRRNIRLVFNASTWGVAGGCAERACGW